MLVDYDIVEHAAYHGSFSELPGAEPYVVILQEITGYDAQSKHFQCRNVILDRISKEAHSFRYECTADFYSTVYIDQSMRSGDMYKLTKVEKRMVPTSVWAEVDDAN